MKTYKQILHILLFVAIIAVTGCSPGDFYQSSIPTPIPKIYVLHTPQAFNGYKFIWSIENAFVLWNAHNTTLGASLGIACFLGDYGKEGSYKTITCLDSSSGSVVWQNISGRALAVTPDGVYVAFAGLAEIRKYNHDNGMLIWKKQLSGNGPDFFYYINEQIQVLTTTGRSDLWILDKDGNNINQLYGDNIYVSLPDVTYIHVVGLEAHSTKTKDILWKYIDSHLQRGPLFTEKTIFLRSGDFLGKAYALDRETGSLLWNLDDIASNEAYNSQKKIVYMLQTDGNLIFVHERTGIKTVIAKLSSDNLIFGGQDSPSYHIAYDEEKNILVVAMGDSHQIFAFEEE